MNAAPAWWSEVRAELSPALAHLRVAVYASGGAPYHHAALIAQWGGVPEPLSAAQIQAGDLKNHDVLVMPGGGLLGMGGLLAPLGVAGSEAIREWVAGGGMYIGSCAGAYLPATVPASFTAQHPAIRPLHLLDVPLANGADAGLGGLDSPGVGVLHATVSDPGHWLARGLPAHFEVVHYNGPCFTPHAGSEVTAITRVEGTGIAFTPWEHSLPGASTPLVETLVADHAANVVTGPFGDGTVVLFGSHPEFGFDVL
uniref:BPL-N domain-containing protein n=1 Tax=Deinococcus sp. TaxID=47478 RepID=UPI00286991D3